MRAGRIVQQGPIADVWAAPADPETALFLGYARVLEGLAAGTVMGRPEPDLRLAVRRSAFRVEPGGALRGVVTGARTTPEQVRLVVDVEGVGEVDAVAPLDAHPAVGERVRLTVDRTRTAVVGGHAAPAEPVRPSLD
jgi:thiamine transport system ATP-binding protein